MIWLFFWFLTFSTVLFTRYKGLLKFFGTLANHSPQNLLK